MKRLLILPVFIFLWCDFSFGQEAAKASDVEKPGLGKIGITYAWWGDNDVFYFQSLEGAPSFDGSRFQTFGLSYVHPLNDWLELETGLDYSKHTISINAHSSPLIDTTPEKTDISLISVPVTVRANFARFFFVNGGLLLNKDIKSSNRIDAQSGIGGLLGIAAKYDFDFGLSVFANPYVKIYTLVPFDSENHHGRLLESGMRFGVTYNLKN